MSSHIAVSWEQQKEFGGKYGFIECLNNAKFGKEPPKTKFIQKLVEKNILTDELVFLPSPYEEERNREKKQLELERKQKITDAKFHEGSKHDNYMEFRKIKYELIPLEEQIDAIYKGFLTITESDLGIDFPQETLDWIEKIKKIKEEHPKSDKHPD